ncbi:MAG TPA: cupin domain-containing protein [Vicinamibacterales bacterium]|jgi:quercetin dioxygenase-like cupin family protein|nr:cupin domain-containing protein [Vicinamibacterales bacterium]
MGDTVSVTHQTWNWATIPRERLADGVVRQMVYGETLMICRLTLAPGTITAAHEHVHEQMTIVEKGRVRFVLGSGERVFGPGDVLLFPSGFWHGATMLDEEVVLVDIFTPLREDFLKPNGDNTTR